MNGLNELVASLTAVFLAVGAPALLAGALAGFALHRSGYRWTTIVLPALAASAVFAGSLVVDPVAGLLEWAKALASYDLGRIVAAGALAWPGIALSISVAVMAAAERSTGRTQPIGLRTLLARGAQAHNGMKAPFANAVMLGRELRSGLAVWVAQPTATVVLLGGSGSGKTTTLGTVTEQSVRHGRGAIVLDGKGDRRLLTRLAKVAEENGRPLFVLSPEPYGDEAIDAARAQINPLAGQSPQQIADLVDRTEEQTEPHYRAIARRGVLQAAKAIKSVGVVPTLHVLSVALEAPSKCFGRTRTTAVAEYLDWRGALTDQDRTALTGMANRLAVLVDTDPGWTLDSGPREVLLAELLRGGGIAYVNVAPDYPSWAPAMARLLIEAIAMEAGRMENAGIRGRALLAVDELSVHDGARIAQVSERTRSAGIALVLSTQSLSNLDTVGGRQLHSAAFDNADFIVVHRLQEPESVRALEQVCGQEERWVSTHRFRFGDLLSTVAPSGHRRKELQPVVSRDEFSRLAPGEAVLICQGGASAVQRLRISPT